MIPQISNSMATTASISYTPSKTYKLSNDRIIGMTDGKEAIQQAVLHILSTERYANLIYDNNYGVEFEKYIGASYDYIEATIYKTLYEALTQDDRITDVVITDMHKEFDIVYIDFDVYSVEGIINMEVGLNV